MYKLFAYFKLFHPYTSIGVTIVTMLLALPLTMHFTIINLATLGIVMLSAQFSIGLSNDLLDQPYDKLVKPWKPLIIGTANSFIAVLFLLMLLLLSFIFTYEFGSLSLLLLIFGLSQGFMYNLGLKRTSLSWLPYSLAIPTVLVFARAVHGGEIYPLLLFYILGFLVGPALNIANQLPEAEASELSGEKSLVHILGVKKARRVSTILLVATALIIIFLSLIKSPVPTFSIIGCLISLFITFLFLFFAEYEFRFILWPLSILDVTILGISLFLIL